MPEFSTSLSESKTDFGQVRSSTPTQGKGDIIAKAISSSLKGVEVFGKSAAETAGKEAVLEAEGGDTSLKEVNINVENIDQKIQDALSFEEESIGGPLSKRQIEESRDGALREVGVTKRDLEAAIQSGVITRTEGNARLRSLVSQVINQGSNYLFKDQFINAAGTTTGGTRGSSLSTMFPKTSDELRAETIETAKVKAIADYEGKKAGLVALTGRSEPQIEREMQSAQTDRTFLAQLEAKRGRMELTANEVAQQADSLQSLSTQTVEQEIAKVAVGGILDEEGLTSSKAAVRNQAGQLRLALSNNKGLSASARKIEMEGINEWEEGVNTRIDSLSKSKFNKTQLEDQETLVKLIGIKAFPHLSVLSGVNPVLASEIAKVPTRSVEGWTKLRTSEEQQNALNAGIKELSRLYSGKPVKDPGKLTVGLHTESGLKDFSNPDSKNSPAWKRMQVEAPADSFVSLRGMFAKKAANFDKDENVRNKIIDHYNMTNSVVASRISYVGSKVPQVVLTPTVENKANLSQFHKTQFNTSIDISDELAQYPDTVSVIEQGYKTFKEQPWLWNTEFENPTDGYNAFLRGEFELKTGLEVEQEEEQEEEKND